MSHLFALSIAWRMRYELSAKRASHIEAARALFTSALLKQELVRTRDEIRWAWFWLEQERDTIATTPFSLPTREE